MKALCRVQKWEKNLLAKRASNFRVFTSLPTHLLACHLMYSCGINDNDFLNHSHVCSTFPLQGSCRKPKYKISWIFQYLNCIYHSNNCTHHDRVLIRGVKLFSSIFPEFLHALLPLFRTFHVLTSKNKKYKISWTFQYLNCICHAHNYSHHALQLTPFTMLFLICLSIPGNS